MESFLTCVSFTIFVNLFGTIEKMQKNYRKLLTTLALFKAFQFIRSNIRTASFSIASINRETSFLSFH